MLIIFLDIHSLFLQIIYPTIKLRLNNTPTQMFQQTLVMPLMKTQYGSFPERFGSHIARYGLISERKGSFLERQGLLLAQYGFF